MGRFKDEMIEAPDFTEEDMVIEIAGEPKTRARPLKHCAECGMEYRPSANNNRFCSNQHRKDYNNREALRGAQLLRVAYHHRRLASGSTPEERKDSGAYLSAMSRLLDGWIREDMREGRKPPIRPADL